MMFSFNLSRIKHIRQWLAALQVFLIMTVAGMTIGWNSPFMGRLIEENPPFNATKEQISWIASLGNLMRPLGSLLAAISNNYYGTKLTLHLTSTISLVVASIALICATSIEHVYITQIFGGIGIGTLYSIYPQYIAEICSSSIRGSLNSMIVQGFLIAIVFGNLMGAYLEPWVYAIIILTLLLIYAATFFFFPDTPYKFIMKNNPEKAAESLKWYQEDVDTTEGIKNMIQFLESKPKLKIMKALKEMAISPINRKVMVILLIEYGLIQFGGIYSILEYSNIIFVEGKITAVDPASLVIIMGAVSIPGCWVSMYTSDRFGRTTILCFSCTLYAIATALLGVNFQLLDLGYDSNRTQWLEIFAASFFRFSMSVGIFGIPMLLMSELLAPNIKNVGACICNVFSSFCCFISNKLFQVMVDYMTYKYVFYLLGGLTFVLGIYAIMGIPETKGKTMEEIQDMLAKSVGDKKKVKRNISESTNA